MLITPSPGKVSAWPQFHRHHTTVHGRNRWNPSPAPGPCCFYWSLLELGPCDRRVSKRKKHKRTRYNSGSQSVKIAGLPRGTPKRKWIAGARGAGGAYCGMARLVLDNETNVSERGRVLQEAPCLRPQGPESKNAALVHIIAKLTPAQRGAVKGRWATQIPAQDPADSARVRNRRNLLEACHCFSFIKSNQFEPSLAWRTGVDMNNSEARGPTHHRTQSTLLHGDVALGSEAPRIDHPVSGEPRSFEICGSAVRNAKRKQIAGAKGECQWRRREGSAKRIWIASTLTRRVCASAAGVVWGVRSAQFYAAVAPVAPGNLSHRDALYTEVYKERQPYVLMRRTCRRWKHGVHVFKELHRESVAESQKTESVSFRESRKGCAQKETVHGAMAVPSLYATRRYEGGDATVLRLKDKCQEPDMVAFGPYTDAKEAGRSKRWCTIVHAVE
ncbi:hypothetical protein EDB89DRAFT_1912351 [Lactarius sanguifluus]|nr:hypothetical protein EDB89DRAFT_1912351 [Lactarius sanguifluus]